MLENIRPPEKPKRSCALRKVMECFDAKDQAVFQSWLDSPQWTNIGISQALNSVGVSLSRTSVQHHRTGGCSCLRK